MPRFVVVPSALEVTARKLVALLGNPSPFEVLVEPRLTSATAYYVIADPATIDGIAYSYPAGNDGPKIEFGRRPGFEGVAGKVVLDFGCGFADFRGVARNAGQ